MTRSTFTVTMVARANSVAHIAAYNFFNNSLSHLLVLQSVQLAHGFYQSACIDNVHQVLWKRCDRVLFSVTDNFFSNGNLDLFTFGHYIAKIGVLNEQKPVVDGIAEEGSGQRIWQSRSGCPVP